jgi:hypothetical protein
MPRRDAIPCDVHSEPVQRAVAEVCAAVQLRHPKDWARLRQRVQRISWLLEDDGSTLGQWRVDREHVAQLRIDTEQDPGFADDEERAEFIACGWIGLSPRVTELPPNVLRAVVAHECGHAVAGFWDLAEREVAFGDAQSAAEMSANLYAFRWGFGEDIRAAQPWCDPRHQGFLPGDIMCWEGGPSYRVDNNFFPQPYVTEDDGPGFVST